MRLNQRGRIIPCLLQLLAGLLVLGASPSAFALELNLGASVGVGSGGVTTQLAPIAIARPISVSRSEGPGAASIFVDIVVDDRWMIFIDHLRTFRPSPVTSGFSQTDLGARWYFLGPPPMVSKSDHPELRLTLSGWSPFVGLSAGYGVASITREGDLFPLVQGDGLMLGFSAGVDFSMSRGFGLRPEVTVSQSVTSPSLGSYLIGVGIYTRIW